MSLTGTTNEQTIWFYLISKGLSPHGAAGLMGNIKNESNFSPTNLENSYEKKLGYTDATYTAAVDDGSYTNFAHDGAGYGLCQWTYWSRKQALLDNAKKVKKSIGDLIAQLDFMLSEMAGYKGLLDILRTATDVRTASDAVLTKYERPADQSETAKARRASYGQAIYNKYAGGSSASTGGTAHTGGTNMSKLYASAVIAVAVAEIGYMEKKTNSQLDSPTANAGSNNWTRYAAFFDNECPNWYNGKKNGYAWCDMFVDYCFHKAYGHENALKLLCQPEKSAGAGCTSSYAYYKQKGQVGTTPKVGAQIFFGTSTSNLTHTGIVEKFDSTYVYTIEGNTSDRVARRTYKRTASNIIGYGYPAYDVEDGVSGGSTGQTVPSAPSTSGEIVYTVKAGDTLSGIAAKYGTTYQALAAYNGISNPNVIRVGQKIRIPSGEKPSASAPAAPSSPQTSTPGTIKVEAAMYFDKAQARTYTVTADSGLNIRAGAGTGKTSLGVLKKGATVRCYGYYNKVGSVLWLYVVANGITGYVCKTYLK